MTYSQLVDCCNGGCNWRGTVAQCVHTPHSLQPLCPQCREVTEPVDERQDAMRYHALRKRLVGMKWADTPFESLRPDDEKYIDADGLDAALDK